MFNPGVYILLRVEHVVSSISLCRRRNQLHQSAGSLAGIRLWIPVRFRFDHRADQCRVHAMPVRRLSNEFFDAVTADLHGRAVASRKRGFGGQVDVGARLRGSEFGCHRQFGVYKKPPSRIVNDLRDLAAGALSEKGCKENRAKGQRRSDKPCRDCRASHHSTFTPTWSGSCLGEGKQQFGNRLQSGQCLISSRPGRGQCPIGTKGFRRAVYSRVGRQAMARLAKPCWRGWRPGQGRTCNDPVRVAPAMTRLGPGLKLYPAGHASGARPDYSKGSRREGILNRALFRAAVSFPPASAKSGLPPPEPPTCLASACMSLPAWTLAVRSLVTPAIRATFPFSGMPSATTPEPSFCRRLSTSCLSPSRSTFCTSAAITLIPLTTCTCAASSSIWLSAPLRFCASSSFSNCLAV